jgi:epoxide hydrolase-like predicted phosphatase
MARELNAVLFDFGGVFTDSPFDAVDSLEAELGARPGQLREIVFGPYDRDTDHPWHRLERGEIALGEARERIVDIGSREGIEVDPLDVLRRMSGGSGARKLVVECVRELRQQGYLTAIVTNNVVEFRPAWTRIIPIEELFDLVIDSSEVGVRKPDRAIYDMTLERLGNIPHEAAVFLDDYPGNVAAAVSLGMKGIVVEADPRPALAELARLLAAGSEGAGS